MVNQATVIPASTAACPSASQKCDLPVPDGPQTQRFSLRCTHSSVLSASWVGRGMVEACSSQSPKVFPAGNAARLRRVRRLAASRPAASSASRTRTTSAGSQRWALAVGIRSVSDRRI
jgi:hypothetical protein